MKPTSPRVNDKVGRAVDAEHEVGDVDEGADVVGRRTLEVLSRSLPLCLDSHSDVGRRPISRDVIAARRLLVGQPAGDDLVDVGDELDRLAEDEEDRDRDEDDAEVGLAPLPGGHLGVNVSVLEIAADVDVKMFYTFI